MANRWVARAPGRARCRPRSCPCRRRHRRAAVGEATGRRRSRWRAIAAWRWWSPWRCRSARTTPTTTATACAAPTTAPGRPGAPGGVGPGRAGAVKRAAHRRRSASPRLAGLGAGRSPRRWWLLLVGRVGHRRRLALHGRPEALRLLRLRRAVRVRVLRARGHGRLDLRADRADHRGSPWPPARPIGLPGHRPARRQQPPRHPDRHRRGQEDAGRAPRRRTAPACSTSC